MLLAIITFFVEYSATTNFLATLSFTLLVLMMVFNFYLNDNDYFSPLTIFSLMYVGYALGGYYYANSGGDFGRFIEFTSIPQDKVVDLFQYALIYAFFSYLSFGLGYVIFKQKIAFIHRHRSGGFWPFFGQYYLLLVVPFLLIGVVYWYWIALVTAGGLVNMLLYFQAFTHLVSDAGVTTLPYHFYHAGIYIWLLGLVVTGKKVGSTFILLSLLGMVIIMSQGRITVAITFIISQLFFIALIDVRNRKKILFYFAVLMGFAFFVYFLRLLSNGLFIGAEVDLVGKGFLKEMIGRGNVADLQQLVLIFHTFTLDKLMLGATYLDWLRNTVGQFFGFEPSSVGLMIKSLYVPDTSGAPVPGAIGEAYANFGVAAVAMMFFIGAAFAGLYRFVMKKGSLFLLLIYAVFLAKFVFIYPKVDSTMMVNFLWGVMPFVVAMLGFYLVFLFLAPLMKTQYVKI